MSGWYGRITADPDNLEPLIDCTEGSQDKG
jgi:hypothetical protein